MHELKQYIKDNTVENQEEMTESIFNMVCSSSDHIPLSSSEILAALNVHGEFLVLKLSYEDLAQELQDEKIKYKISQALSVVVTYEDDGKSFGEIEKFVNYIHKLSDSKQNSIFGIKQVQKLSEFPITILFSGILPINQLKMEIGKELYDLIESDREYFKKYFAQFRDELSKEINIPILPVYPLYNSTLAGTEVLLSDLLGAREICRFTTQKKVDLGLIESYLMRLFYVYKTLATATHSE